MIKLIHQEEVRTLHIYVLTKTKINATNQQYWITQTYIGKLNTVSQLLILLTILIKLTIIKHSTYNIKINILPWGPTAHLQVRPYSDPENKSQDIQTSNRIKLSSLTTMELNYKSITKKYWIFLNIWDLNSILLNNLGIKEKIQKGNQKFF